MKNVYVLGNWKSNKTITEAKDWIKTFAQQASKIPKHVTTILCPGFHHLQLFDKGLFPVSIGAQNVSAFASGAYTGEVAAPMLMGLAEYVLIGHSERRKHLLETDEIVANKTMQALTVGIRPVVCVSDLHQVESLHSAVPEFQQKGLLLYEPVSAIGTGQADSPESANAMAMTIANVIGAVPILYGGSVVPENVQSFVKQEYIAGVGVGGASLDADKFMKVILSAGQD